jgi:hypothetical protein
MDSEDEFMSDPPSGDEIDFDEGTQDSDVASLGGGVYIYPFSITLPADKRSQISIKITMADSVTRRTSSRIQRNPTKSSIKSLVLRTSNHSKIVNSKRFRQL